MADVTTVATAEAHREKIHKEYSQYVATEPITIDGALAFAPGHPVPAGHVKRYGLDKIKAVKKVDTGSASSEKEG